MTYSVKEIFMTLQGEGVHSGRPAVFCRLSGCNLWSGRERDRANAICTFCDTDFVGTDGTKGGRYASAGDLAQVIADEWPGGQFGKYVVLTGGEPILQVDQDLIEELHNRGFEVAVETNGTLPVPHGLDWVCVSPKWGAKLVVESGNELKLVYPQDGMDPAVFEELSFENYSLQPKDCDEAEANLQAAISYCIHNPRWRLSVQSHKSIGIR